MTFTVNALTRCAGGNHYQVSLTFGGGSSAVIHLTREDLDFDPSENLSEAREKVLDRLRSAVKEAGAATFAQARVALETKTFKV